MAQLKTRKTGASVSEFIKSIVDDRQRKDSKTIARIMQRVTGAKPRMWGPSIIGFGSYHYKYASGREGDWPLTGFSPRKGNLTLYIMDGFSGYKKLLARLGKHRTGKACLYIKKLDDVDLEVLEEMISRSVENKSRSGSSSGC
jgi:hypothetical protein